MVYDLFQGQQSWSGLTTYYTIYKIASSVHVSLDIFNTGCTGSVEDSRYTMRVVITMTLKNHFLFCRFRMLLNPGMSQVTKPTRA